MKRNPVVIPAVLGLLMLPAERVEGQSATGKPLGIEGGALKMPAGNFTVGYVLSADGTRIAVAVHKGSRVTLSVDGVAQEPLYDRLGQFRGQSEEKAKAAVPAVFSPDGSRFAYIGMREGAFRVVVDGKEGPPSSGISMDSFQFSADGKRFAYKVNPLQGDGAQEMYQGVPATRAVIDHEAGPAFSSVDGLRFSPGGKHVAYVGGLRGNYAVVVDGKTVGTCGKVRDLSFSGDGEHWAYTCEAKLESRAEANGPAIRVFVDGKPEAKAYSDIHSFQWSAQGAHYGYIGMTPPSSGAAGPGSEAVIDGKAVSAGVKGIAGSALANLVLSADGLRHAYKALRFRQANPGEFAVVDGVAGQEFRGILQLGFTPDSKHSYVLGGTASGGAGPQSAYLIFDGEEFEGPFRLHPFLHAFSDKRYVYAKKIGGEWTAVLEGGAAPVVSGIKLSGNDPMQMGFVDVRTLVASPDGSVLLAPREGGAAMVKGKAVAGIKLSRFGSDRSYPSQFYWFSPDSKHVAYAAESQNPSGGRTFAMYVDEIEVSPSCRCDAPRFSPDSRHIAYVETKQIDHAGKPTASTVYLDGKAVADVEYVLGSGVEGPAFLADGSLRFFAVQQGELKMFTIGAQGSLDEFLTAAASRPKSVAGSGEGVGLPGQQPQAAPDPSGVVSNPAEAIKDQLRKRIPRVFGGKKKPQ
jgi:roadblock/LC7 domain-containing protein